MDEKRQADFYTEVTVKEASPKVKPPSLYTVVLLNDDYTPMDFVVDLLETIFGAAHERAVQVMLQIHTKGKGICGVYSRDIAETKVVQVTEYAKQHQHPLLCRMEKA